MKKTPNKQKGKTVIKKLPFLLLGFQQEVRQMDLVQVATGTSYSVCFYKLIFVRYVKCISCVDINTDFQHY